MLTYTRSSILVDIYHFSRYQLPLLESLFLNKAQSTIEMLTPKSWRYPGPSGSQGATNFSNNRRVGGTQVAGCLCPGDFGGGNGNCRGTLPHVKKRQKDKVKQGKVKGKVP